MNPFINLIQKNLEIGPSQLRQLYLTAVKATHPDRVGSDRHIEEFIKCRRDYEEAMQWLSQNKSLSRDQTHPSMGFRFSFYLALYHLSCLRQEEEESFMPVFQIFKAKTHQWKSEWDSFLEIFWRQYLEIRDIKFSSDITSLRYPVLYKRLRPFLYNICKYNITGKSFYIMQMSREKNTLFYELENKKYNDVLSFCKFLIIDLKNGPALWD